MRRYFLLLCIACVSLAVGGCASTESVEPTDMGGVSTIPWNRPERGEGAGMMGGMLNSR